MNPVCDVNPFSHQCSLHMLHGNVKHPSATTILEWTQILFPAYIHNNDWTGLVNSLVYVGIKLGHFSMHECMAMPKDNPKDLWLYIKSIIEIKGKENPSDSSSSSYFSMAAKGLYCWNAFNYAHHLLSADKIHDHVESTSLFFFYSKASLPQSKNTRSPEGPSKIQRREEGEATMVYTQVDSSNMQSLQSCLDAWKLLHQITPVPEGRNTNLQAGDGELKALLDFMPKSTIWWMVAIIDTHLGSGQPLPSVFMDRLNSELEFLHKLLSGVPLNHRLVISSRIFFQLYQAELKTSPVEAYQVLLKIPNMLDMVSIKNGLQDFYDFLSSEKEDEGDPKVLALPLTQATFLGAITCHAISCGLKIQSIDSLCFIQADSSLFWEELQEALKIPTEKSPLSFPAFRNSIRDLKVTEEVLSLACFNKMFDVGFPKDEFGLLLMEKHIQEAKFSPNGWLEGIMELSRSMTAM